ncbi:MAG: hypothetical protein OXI27_01460 [Thaumarchaeota archaeon]|nr:hypothetical protein [Nitrososphaerota archaeon]
MIEIAGYDFDGPYNYEQDISNAAGIYVILDQRSDVTYVVDVGESETIRERITHHDRKTCWKQNVRGRMSIAVHYAEPIQRRKQIERVIREKYKPACGKE